MPQTAQNAAECYGLTRRELDAYAVASHQKARAAYTAGAYRDEIVPLEIELPVFDASGAWLEDAHGARAQFDRDEYVSADTDLDQLAALAPVKGLVSFGERELVITTGNGCPLADGIAAVLLVSESLAAERGLEPLARIRGIGVAGSEVIGARLVSTLAHELRRSGTRYGLAAQCIGAGMGIATVLERVD